MNCTLLMGSAFYNKSQCLTVEFTVYNNISLGQYFLCQWDQGVSFPKQCECISQNVILSQEDSAILITLNLQVLFAMKYTGNKNIIQNKQPSFQISLKISSEKLQKKTRKISHIALFQNIFIFFLFSSIFLSQNYILFHCILVKNYRVNVFLEWHPCQFL